MIKIEQCSFMISPFEVGKMNELFLQLSPKATPLDKEKIHLVLSRSFIFLAIDTKKKNHMCPIGMIVGMASITFIPKLSGTIGQIEDVVVDKNYRKKGIARKLMRKLLQLAKEKDRHVRHIDLTCNPSREAANLLYQNIGFKHRLTNSYRLTFTSA